MQLYSHFLLAVAGLLLMLPAARRITMQQPVNRQALRQLNARLTTWEKTAALTGTTCLVLAALLGRIGG